MGIKHDLQLPSTLVSFELSTVGHGVMTRAAAAKLPASYSVPFKSSAPDLDNPKKSITKGAETEVSIAESVEKPEDCTDADIVSAASVSTKEHINTCQPLTVSCPLLTDL